MGSKMGCWGLVAVLAVACGEENGAGNGGDHGTGNGTGNGSSCGGGAFSLEYSGDASGTASGDCVVAVFLDSSPVGSISVLEETGGIGDGASLILTFTQPELDLQSAAFSDPDLGEDVGCGIVDISGGGLADAVTFTRNDESGYGLDLAFDLACCPDGALVCDESEASNLRLTGTISGDRAL
jgi:hypothetical protein